MADNELSAILSRRQQINDGIDGGEPTKPRMRVFNPYTEFPEFSRKEIKDYEMSFKRYDEGNDGYIDLEELKRMMEKLGEPQTHISLKEMIKEVDEDSDNKICFREFLLIYRKARQGDLAEDSGLRKLAALTEIDVDKEGVAGAKNFFEAKINDLNRSKKFEDEIKSEQEQKRKELEDKKIRQQAFREKANFYEQGLASSNGVH
jgi:hypothetical protein